MTICSDLFTAASSTTFFKITPKRAQYRWHTVALNFAVFIGNVVLHAHGFAARTIVLAVMFTAARQVLWLGARKPGWMMAMRNR